MYGKQMLRGLASLQVRRVVVVAALAGCFAAHRPPPGDGTEPAPPPAGYEAEFAEPGPPYADWEAAYLHSIEQLIENRRREEARNRATWLRHQKGPSKRLDRDYKRVLAECLAAASPHPLSLEGAAPARRLVIAGLPASARLFDALLARGAVTPGSLVLTLREQRDVSLDPAWEPPLRRALSTELLDQDRTAGLCLLHLLSPTDATVRAALETIARSDEHRFAAEAVRAVLFDPRHRPYEPRPRLSDANDALASAVIAGASPPGVREAAAEYLWCRGRPSDARAVLVELLVGQYPDREAAGPFSSVDWFHAKRTATEWLFYVERSPAAFRAIYDRARIVQTLRQEALRSGRGWEPSWHLTEEALQARYLLDRVPASQR